MNAQQTITHYVVVPEIELPQTESEKFNNSDKPWSEVNLGHNTAITSLAARAVELASQLTMENKAEG